MNKIFIIIYLFLSQSQSGFAVNDKYSYDIESYFQEYRKSDQLIRDPFVATPIITYDLHFNPAQLGIGPGGDVPGGGGEGGTDTGSGGGVLATPIPDNLFIILFGLILYVFYIHQTKSKIHSKNENNKFIK